MSNRIFVGDVGTDIILDSGSDLSTQTELKIQYEKPSGITGEWTATVYQTNSAKYETLVDDIDEAGIWRFRIYVVMTGWSGYGEEDSIRVHALDWCVA